MTINFNIYFMVFGACFSSFQTPIRLVITIGGTLFEAKFIQVVG